MLSRNVYKTTVTGEDVLFEVHPGKGTTDWNLLSVLVSRDDDEEIEFAVTLVDIDGGDEFKIGEFLTWDDTNFVFSELLRLDRNLLIRITTDGVTTDDVRVRVIAMLKTTEFTE